MDAADEVDVLGQVTEHALAAVGTIAGDDDEVVGEPGRRQFDEFQGQFRASAMVGIGLGFLGLGLAFLPFGEPLMVAVEPGGHGQGEDLGGSPGRMDNDDAEDDPIMSPTDQRFLAAGDERVVVHAGAVEGQPSSPAERVIDGPEDRGPRCDDGDDELGEHECEGVDVPGGVAEEAMKAAPVSVGDVSAGEDDFGDEEVSLGEDPASDDLDEGGEGGRGEDGDERL